MPFVAVPNVVQVVVGGTIGQYNWAHVMHFTYTGGPPSQAALGAAANVVLQSWNTAFQGSMPTTTVTTNAHVTDLGSQTGAAGEALGNFPGLSGTEGAPANCSVLISKAINRRYRGGHPRAYLPVGLAANMTDPAHWSQGNVTAWEGDYAGFISKLANGGMWAGAGFECCVHRHLNGQLLQQPLVDEVQSYTASTQIASQRRRIGR